jgi:peroxiredoxin
MRRAHEQRRRGYVRRLAGVALVFLAMLGGCERHPPAAVRIGAPLPALQVQSLGGATVSLDRLRGKVIVFNVWAVWCRPCREEMPSLERLSAQLDPDHFAVVGLSVDRDRYLVDEFLRRYRIRFPIYLDPDRRVATQLGVKVFPETLLVAADGTLQARVIGARAWDRPAVRALLARLYRDGHLGSGQVQRALSPSMQSG